MKEIGKEKVLKLHQIEFYYFFGIFVPCIVQTRNWNINVSSTELILIKYEVLAGSYTELKINKPKTAQSWCKPSVSEIK